MCDKNHDLYENARLYDIFMGKPVTKKNLNRNMIKPSSHNKDGFIILPYYITFCFSLLLP
jgi:hypothetical protein